MNVDVIEPFNRLQLLGGAKISAVHSSNGLLYLGMTNGDLTIMRASTQVEPSKSAPRSLRSFRSFSEIKRLFSDNSQSQLLLDEKFFPNVTGNQTAITALETIPLYKDSSREVLLIGNSDVLQVYEWVGAHLNLVKSFDEAKGNTKFGYMETNDQRLLLLGSRKKLSVYLVSQKSRNVFDFVLAHDFALKERVRAISCYDKASKALIGLNHSFMVLQLDGDVRLEELPTVESTIYNLSQSTSFSYFGLSSAGPEVKIIQIGASETLIVRDAQVGKVFLDENGFGALKDSNIKLTAVPNNVAYLHPCYILAVYSKTLEVIDIESGSVIQQFRHQLNVNATVLTTENSIVTVGAGANVFQFSYLPYQKQLDQYLSISGPGSSTKSVKDPNNDLRLLGLERALTLVSSLDDEDEFFHDKTDPLMTRRKMKELFLRDLYKEKATIYFISYSKYHESLVDIASEWVLCFNDILPLFPDFLNGRTQMSQDCDPQTSPPSGSKNAVKRVSLELINEARGPNGTLSSATDSEVKDSEKNNSSAGPALEDQKSQSIRKFRKAVNNLIIYLTDQRRIHLSFLNSSDPMPTILWKNTNLSVTDVYPGLDNHTIKDHLLNFGAYIDTTLFLCYFYTRPMMLGPLLRLPNNRCSAKVVNECLLKNIHGHTKQLENFLSELLDFYFGRRLHEDALKMLSKLAHEEVKGHENDFDHFLRGPDLTIRYLQRLTNEYLDVVFRYSHWVLTESPDEALNRAELIFMNDSYECESYDNFKVFDYLKSVSKKDDLAIRYLEWLLDESDILQLANRREHATKFATKLCLFYLKRLKALKVPTSEFYEDENYKKLYSFLENKKEYEPWTVLKNIPTSQDRFLRFTIFIYKKLGEHQKSVDVLYNQLSDLDGAMNYCAEVYNEPNGEKAGQDLLHKLLEDLLMHYEENQDAIARLLTLQGAKMSVLHIITALPNSFPLHKLKQFLVDTTSNTNERLYTSRTTSQLYKIGSSKLHYKLLMAQKPSYSITNANQRCHLCGTRLDYSVLCVDKDGHIVHYGCYNDHDARDD